MQKSSVIIVEDERIFALDLKNRLERNNFSVVGTAVNSRDALKLVVDHKPSIVLMDINIEGEDDGIVTAEKIREHSGTPVIFLTAYTDDSLIDRAAKTFPYGYLVKPCETRELLATINIALSKHQSERIFKDQARRYQSAMQAYEMTVWEWDPDDEKTVFDGPVDIIFGEMQDYFNDDVEVFLKKFIDNEREKIRDMLLSGQAISGIYSYIKKDRSPGWFDVNAHVVQVDSVKKVIGVIKDVTERHLLEVRLQKASKIFESTLEGVVIADAETRITSINPSFCQLTAFQESDVINQKIDQILHIRRHNPAFYQSLTGVENKVWRGEIYCRRKDNSCFLAWEQIHVVCDEEGKITNFLFSFYDIANLHEIDRRLGFLAHHDSLTGLSNRILFMDRLEQELYRCQRAQGRFSLAFIDLDNFKIINDTLGHDAGDKMLKIVAQRLRDEMRRTDTLARLGGDEFVVIVSDIDNADHLSTLVNKWIEIITQPCEIGEQSISVSASIGIACYPDDAEDATSLLKAADNAMYHAKNKGRNACEFFTPGMAEKVEKRMMIEQGLRRALDNPGELLLLYQPVFNLVTNEIVAAEALIRWRHPVRGMISPDDFIPVAEESNLINQLGNWVIDRACHQLSVWNKKDIPVRRIAINVSPRQLAVNGLYEIFAEAIQRHGIDASCLELEITERAMYLLEQTSNALQKLRTLGVSISIDDFGTGYSSLSMLKNLPLDRLKIDKAFTADLLKNGSGDAIASAIIGIGHALNLEIIAEGIETQAQFDKLRRLGCQMGQGYLISKPIDPQAFEEFIVKR